MHYDALVVQNTLPRLPELFCWTRFGTEAGEPFERILERKDVERLLNDGVFFWGIGNSVAPGVRELVRRCECPEVLFSPIKSRPRAADVAPAAVVTWSAAETLDGERFELPPTVRVTSRFDKAAAAAHYALVCSSQKTLQISDFGTLSFRGLRNLLSGRALGSSQVTAVVRQISEQITDEAEYVVALRTLLVAPYFVRLREPTLNLGPRLAS